MWCNLFIDFSLYNKALTIHQKWIIDRISPKVIQIYSFQFRHAAHSMQSSTTIMQYISHYIFSLLTGRVPLLFYICFDGTWRKRDLVKWYIQQWRKCLRKYVVRRSMLIFNSPGITYQSTCKNNIVLVVRDVFNVLFVVVFFFELISCCYIFIRLYFN